MSDPLIPGLIDRLRWARHLRGLTAAEVDHGAGLSKGYTATLEAGGILDPGVIRLNRLAKFYGVTVDALINFGESK